MVENHPRIIGYLPFLPGEFDLDMRNEEDAQLYIDSEGDSIIAQMLLAVGRKLRDQRMQGKISPEDYDDGMIRLDERVKQRSKIIHAHPRP